MLFSLLMILDNPQDRQRFIALYHQYYGYLFRIAYEILQDDVLAEDAVQESFEAVIRHFETFEEPASPKTRNTLRIILRNKAINMYNKRKRQQNALPLEEHGEMVPSAPAEGEQGLFFAMEQLKEEYQEILMLRFDSGYSAAEIADLLGISRENAKRRLSRAKAALAEILKKEGML